MRSIFLPAEKLLVGNPLRKAWTHYTDASGKFFTSKWQSESGKWKIAYTEDEHCHILEGRGIITDATENPLTVTVAESFVGTWEVVETTTKHFVIYEAGT
ncbi:MAG: putative cupin superfamily protein [Gammaproteobacteria bacterium]